MPDQTPQEPAPELEQPERAHPHHAHPHHKDKGRVVTTAFGEPVSGAIADITDGDDD
ncbi:MAG: hypothetical protein JWQ29_1373 [Phenylobacterium sp.]|nr:hypothetical protein [Phenylobacterium sp.]